MGVEFRATSSWPAYFRYPNTKYKAMISVKSGRIDDMPSHFWYAIDYDLTSILARVQIKSRKQQASQF